MIVGVTGATSAIGADVMSEIVAGGDEAVPLGRRPAPNGRRYDLGEPVADSTLDGLDAVVHLAWSWGDDQEINRRAGLGLVQAAERSGTRVILLSTFSAFASATSQYGAAKQEIELAACASGGSALRSGLIWGGDHLSGMMSTLARIARVPGVAARLTPDPLMYVSAQKRLAEDLASAARGEAGRGEVLLGASPTPVPLSAILRALRGTRGGIPVAAPTRLIAAGASLASRAHIKLPFRPDSISALTSGSGPGQSGDSLDWAAEYPGPEQFLTWVRKVSS